MAEEVPEKKQTEPATCAYERSDGNRCGRPTLLDSKGRLCLFHEPVESKDPKKSLDAFLKLLDEGGSDLEGFRLPGVDLSGRVFHADVSLRNAVFAGDVSFKDATFPEMVDLNGATFEGDVSFEAADFAGSVDLSGARFRKRALFRDATFGGDACFKETRFGPVADLDRARFAGDARFDKARFGGELRLANAEFGRYSLFLEATCEGQADFSFAVFKAYADFAGSRWSGLNMTDVIFERRGCFDGAVISSGTFEDAELRHVTLRDVDLANVFTTGASLEEAYMAEARWGKPERGPLGKKLEVREETLADEEGTRDALRRAESAHRNLKESYKNEGDYETAGEFFIREMAIKRKTAWLDREYGYWVMSSTIAGLCGYGERPARVIFWWFAFVFIFGVIYFAGHLIAPSGEGDVDYGDWRGFATCLYFSVVTFTTLGFGDFHPITDAGRAVASLEAFTGAFMIALFVLVFGRKMIR